MSRTPWAHQYRQINQRMKSAIDAAQRPTVRKGGAGHQQRCLETKYGPGRPAIDGVAQQVHLLLDLAQTEVCGLHGLRERRIRVDGRGRILSAFGHPKINPIRRIVSSASSIVANRPASRPDAAATASSACCRKPALNAVSHGWTSTGWSTRSPRFWNEARSSGRISHRLAGVEMLTAHGPGPFQMPS